jgi:hypothetical protein
MKAQNSREEVQEYFVLNRRAMVHIGAKAVYADTFFHCEDSDIPSFDNTPNTYSKVESSSSEKQYM